MIRIKSCRQVSIQKSNNLYHYLKWRDYLLMEWDSKLHEKEKDQINIGPTSLVEWKND